MKRLDLAKYYKFKDAVEYQKNNPTISKTKLAQLFNINRKSEYLDSPKSLNEFKYIYKDAIYSFKEEEFNIINEYIETDITKQGIEQKYRLKSETLTKYLRILDLPERKYIKQYNRNSFKEILTEEDAYWLGFITADGYLNEDRHFLNIKLAEKDYDHLVKFCNYMQANPNDFIIKDMGASGNLVFSVTFNSIDIENNLKQYNIKQAKSTKETYYHLPKNLIRHYIRGIFDGDGGFSTNHKKEVIDRMQIVGSLDILINIKKEIEENVINVNPINIKQGNLYVLLISGYDKIYKISEWLYKDINIYLDRKYEQYNRLRIEQQKRGRE